MDKIKELIEKRASIWETQKALNDKAVAEKRDLTAEEQEAWNKADVDFQAVDKEIRDIQTEAEKQAKSDERNKAMKDRADYMKKSQVAPIKPDPDANKKREDRKVNPMATEEYRAAFGHFLRTGDLSRIDTEFRALQADSDVAGGFVVAPEQFVAQLIKDLEDEVFVRRYARVISVPNAASLTAPELANRIGDPTWTAENSALSAVMN